MPFFDKKYFLAFLFLIFIQNVQAVFNAKNTSSILKIKSGGNFVVDTTINDYKGTIIKEEGGNISGNIINIIDGKIRDQGNKFNVTGEFKPGESNSIILNGGKSFRGKGGDVLQDVFVSGEDNSLEGDFLLSNDIEFEDSDATLNCNVKNKFGVNVVLNGGKLVLNDNLSFVDNKRIYGPGKLLLNGNSLSFGSIDMLWREPLYFDSGADVELNSNTYLENSWVFSGISVLNGNNNIIEFQGDDGKIIIERGSSLIVKNAEIRNFKDSAFFCMDNAGTVTFQNTKIILSNDYTFSQGKFNVLSKFKISGRKKFTYNTNQKSVISTYSTFYLDCGVTFSYDPPDTQKDKISFKDFSSILNLQSAILYSTNKGLHLKRGRIIVEGRSYFFAEPGEGIIIGYNLLEDDCAFEISIGSVLNVLSGRLDYRNIDVDSWVMRGNYSILDINSGAAFCLYKSLDVTPGLFRMSKRAMLFKDDCCYLNGSFFVYE